MKRYFLSVAAAVMATSFIAFTTPEYKTLPGKREVTEYYFKFMGDHGQESNTSLWELIDESAYNGGGCPGGNKGCRIKTTAATGSPLTPTEVPTDLNDTPIISGTVIGVRNKN